MKKNNRNLFYSDYQAGGFAAPNMMNNQGMGMQGMPGQPSGYMMNNNYMSYGPNALPEQYNNYGDENTNNYELRLTKLERQIRKLESRVSKLETNTEVIDDTTNNLYMI